MSKTQSTMVALGTHAPPFELFDVISGRTLTRDQITSMTPATHTANEAPNAAAPGLLVMFLCVHCPYVKHVEQELAQIGRDYEGRIAIAAVSSNDIEEFPQDGPEEMKAQAQRLGSASPICSTRPRRSHALTTQPAPLTSSSLTAK